MLDNNVTGRRRGTLSPEPSSGAPGVDSPTPHSIIQINTMRFT